MEGNKEQSEIDKVIRALKESGEELTSEQAELMLDSMKQLVTLAINQYFRKISNTRNDSSTKY